MPTSDADQGTELVKVQGDLAPRSWPARPVLEVVLCVVGGLLATYFPAIGCALMVAGVWLLARPQEGKAAWGVIACLAALACLCLVSWEDYGSIALPSVVIACLIALLPPRLLGVSAVVALILAAAGITMGLDALILQANGVSLTEYVGYVFDTVAEQAAGGGAGSDVDVRAAAAVQQGLELVRQAWPAIYLGQGCVTVVCGLVSLALVRRVPYSRLYLAFLRYRVPFWGLVLLAAAVVCWGVSELGSAGSSALLSFALCTLLCLRVLYLLQGLACAMALMERARIGQVGRIAVLFAALFLELGFYAMCVFGLIDSFADFRGLRSSEVETSGETVPQDDGARD